VRRDNENDRRQSKYVGRREADADEVESWSEEQALTLAKKRNAPLT